MTAAYLSFLGVLAGATLQFFFAGFLEQRKHLRDLKAQAYLDYLKSIAETTITSSRSASSEHKNALASVVNAKAKICLYGSKSVVYKLSLFEKMGASFKSESQKECFVDMFKAMRKDLGSNYLKDASSLKLCLLGE